MKLAKALKTRVKNLNKPTPAKWVKIGLSLTAVSAAIGGYGLTNGIEWVSYLGLICIVSGTFITNMFAEPSEKIQPTREQ